MKFCAACGRECPYPEDVARLHWEERAAWLLSQGWDLGFTPRCPGCVSGRPLTFTSWAEVAAYLAQRRADNDARRALGEGVYRDVLSVTLADPRYEPAAGVVFDNGRFDMHTAHTGSCSADSPCSWGMSLERFAAVHPLECCTFAALRK